MLCDRPLRYFKEIVQIDDFLRMEDGDCLTNEQSQALNRALCKIQLEDYAGAQHSQIADYLVTALNMASVSSEDIPILEALLTSLQKSR